VLALAYPADIGISRVNTTYTDYIDYYNN